MKIALPEIFYFYDTLYLVHKLIPMPQAMKIPDAKSLPWTRNGKSSRQFHHGIGEKSKAKRSLGEGRVVTSFYVTKKEEVALLRRAQKRRF